MDRPAVVPLAAPLGDVLDGPTVVPVVDVLGDAADELAEPLAKPLELLALPKPRARRARRKMEPEYSVSGRAWIAIDFGPRQELPKRGCPNCLRAGFPRLIPPRACSIFRQSIGGGRPVTVRRPSHGNTLLRKSSSNAGLPVGHDKNPRYLIVHRGRSYWRPNCKRMIAEGFRRVQLVV